MDKSELYIEHFIDSLIGYIPNLFKGIVILIIGVIAIRLFRKLIQGLMRKKNLDPTLLQFVMDVATWILRVMLFISVITQLGVPTTSFVTVLGAAGLAVGLSLQGSLSNFAGGILIIMFKPFRVSDYIEAQGQGGTVDEIQIFTTKIITSGNQVVYIPNGALSNGTIKNFSNESTRRAEIIIGVSYNSNLKIVKEVISRIILSDPKILTSPAPGIEIKNLGDNAVVVAIYLWAERPDYFAMVSDFYENVKEAFDEAGIELPFPQRDVHVKISSNES